MVVLLRFWDRERSQYFERPIVNKDLHLWKNAIAAVGRGEECVLLVVVESIGSSPGRAGFKALVTGGGELFGSIGGGSMEHKLVELARAKLLASAQNKPFLKRQIHRAEEPADRSGMICSGEQTVGFYPIGKAQRKALLDIINAVDVSEQTMIQFDQHGFSIDVLDGSGEQALQHVSDKEWCYTEPINKQPRLLIFGAGHVGLALSRTMYQLGFHVHLMDDRADLNTLAANQWTHQRSVVDYATVDSTIADDPELFIVLVSFGYRTDDILVRQLIRKKFKYLGMMGSAEKIKKLLKDMRSDGYTDEELRRLHAPIGLPIQSRTPEEIAVSIAAEIIMVKNGG